jgi:hypothetical protein
MSDLVRGARSSAACIAARLVAIKAPLTAEQYARLVRVVAEKENWDRLPMTAAAREAVQRGCRKRDAVQAAD